MGGPGSGRQAPCAASPRHSKPEPSNCSNEAGKAPNDGPTVLAVLNERWRVVDDPLQWILQRQQGHLSSGVPRFQDVRFCVSRRGLLRSIQENAARWTWPRWQ